MVFKQNLRLCNAIKKPDCSKLVVSSCHESDNVSFDYSQCENIFKIGMVCNFELYQHLLILFTAIYLN